MCAQGGGGGGEGAAEVGAVDHEVGDAVGGLDVGVQSEGGELGAGVVGVEFDGWGDDGLGDDLVQETHFLEDFVVVGGELDAGSDLWLYGLQKYLREYVRCKIKKWGPLKMGKEITLWRDVGGGLEKKNKSSCEHDMRFGLFFVPHAIPNHVLGSLLCSRLYGGEWRFPVRQGRRQ